MGKQKVKIKQTLETAEVVKHLKDLAQSLESGVIRAEGDENTVILRVPGTMDFELKATRKDEKAKCSLELAWEDDGTLPGGFKISGE